MSGTSRSFPGIRAALVNRSWKDEDFAVSKRFKGHSPQLYSFMPEDEWQELFFRVEHVPVAALVSLDDLGLTLSVRQATLPKVMAKIPPHPEREMVVVPTAVGQAIIRADDHLQVFKLVAKDNALVTHLQWAHAALAVWHRFDHALRLSGAEPEAPQSFPRGFLLAAWTNRGGAQVEMTFGPSEHVAYERAQAQMPTLDIVARNSYDQSIALTLSPGFRIVSSEPWFEATVAFPEEHRRESQRWGASERRRGVEHYIPHSFALKLTGQERTALVRAYFEQLGMPLKSVISDTRYDAVGSLLDVCAEYVSDAKSASHLTQAPQYFEDDAPSPGYEPESTRGREVQRTLDDLMHTVGTYVQHLKGLANQSLGAAHKLPLLTAVLHRKEAILSSDRLTEPEEKRLFALRFSPHLWEGLSVWQRSMSHGSATADTLLEALFVMVVHREHLQFLFDLNATEFDQRIDKFVADFGGSSARKVMPYVRGFDGPARMYFGRVL